MKKNILNERVSILAVEIISRAIKDLRGEGMTFYQKCHYGDYLKLTAESFLKSDTCKFYCEALNVNHNRILKNLEI